MHNQSKFDMVRGLACLAVLFSHLVQVYWHKQLGPQHNFAIFSNIIGQYSVYIFFFLSGYLIALSIINNIAKNSRFSITDYAIARFCRIYPPLVLSVILVVVLHQLIIWLNLPGGTQPYGAPADLYQVRTFFSLTWRDVLGSLLLINGLSIANGALWSLYFEVWCYAIAGYFTWSWYATNNKLRGLFLCFGLLITALVCVYKPDFLMYALLWLVGFLCCLIVANRQKCFIPHTSCSYY
jgi:peptidoglycan/LPS O-acetylase OafA/YrhL